jgi:hypothetical protein
MGLYMGWAHAWPDYDRWSKWNGYVGQSIEVSEWRYEGAKHPHRMGKGRVGSEDVDFREGELEELLGPPGLTRADRDAESAIGSFKSTRALWNAAAMVRAAPAGATEAWALGRMESSLGFAASGLALGLFGGWALWRSSRGRAIRAFGKKSVD